MKTIEQIVSDYNSETLDGRDLTRLSQFLTAEQVEKVGLAFTSDERKAKHKPIEFTRENILKQLEGDVAFGFEKALNKRGISASFMYAVVQMWNWILEEGLEDFDTYAQYGLPLFKATARKYNFPNPIGDDQGDEYKYSYEAEVEEYGL